MTLFPEGVHIPLIVKSNWSYTWKIITWIAHICLGVKINVLCRMLVAVNKRRKSCAVFYRGFLGRCQWGARAIDFDADLHVAYLEKFNMGLI